MPGTLRTGVTTRAKQSEGDAPLLDSRIVIVVPVPTGTGHTVSFLVVDRYCIGTFYGTGSYSTGL